MFTRRYYPQPPQCSVTLIFFSLILTVPVPCSARWYPRFSLTASPGSISCPFCIAWLSRRTATCNGSLSRVVFHSALHTLSRRFSLLLFFFFISLIPTSSKPISLHRIGIPFWVNWKCYTRLSVILHAMSSAFNSEPLSSAICWPCGRIDYVWIINSMLHYLHSYFTLIMYLDRLA